jgi:hypothetical protein
MMKSISEVLAALARSGALHVGPIVYEAAHAMPVVRGPTPAEALTALGQGFRWQRAADGRYQLAGRVTGRLLLSNYDPAALPDAERERLDAEARALPASCIRVDVRPDGPGGEYPLRGWFVLRSFLATLAFLGRGIAEDLEFAVEPDPRSAFVGPNPARSLEITEGRRAPRDAEYEVEFEDRHYWIRKLPVSQDVVTTWNQQAFALLMNLFQMTITDVSTTPTPVISIPK